MFYLNFELVAHFFIYILSLFTVCVAEYYLVTKLESIPQLILNTIDTQNC
jgi:hypothetical protein